MRGRSLRTNATKHNHAVQRDRITRSVLPFAGADGTLFVGTWALVVGCVIIELCGGCVLFLTCTWTVIS